MKIIVRAQIAEPVGPITMKPFTRIIKDCGPPLVVQWEFLRDPRGGRPAHLAERDRQGERSPGGVFLNSEALGVLFQEVRPFRNVTDCFLGVVALPRLENSQ